MDENNNNEDRASSIHDSLKEICSKIRESYISDKDETKYFNKLIEMLKEMLTHSTLEEYFSNNEELLNYFMGNFLSEVIKFTLIQKTVFGENGDELALDLLLHIFKLFLKFHKNEKYSPLFEKIRNIFNYNNNNVTFYDSHKFKDDEDEKKYNNSYFNEQFCSEFKKKLDQKSFNVGDEVDFLVEKNIGKQKFEKKFWARGKINEIREGEYVISYFDDEEKAIPVDDFNIFEKNSKAKDWDWRSNLKKYDVVDCFDRNKWFPATITEVKEMENNGYKNNIYNVAFRLYPKHFKNPEDENDTFDKHIGLWKKSTNSEEEPKDKDGEEYIGDPDNYSEDLNFYSKRIQKFNLYSSIQLKDPDYQSTGSNSNKNNDRNPLNIIYDNLIKETDVPIDDFFEFEVNGKKNYILGKNKNFYYFYALLLKSIEKENSFSEFIDILKDKPTTEEIYNIFYILTYCFPYLHKDYFKQNDDIIKNSLIRYINDLKEKEMRNLPKDLINIVTNLLYNINEYNKGENDDNKKDSINSYDEVAITLSLKTIKTSIFGQRLQGIKTLIEFIEQNQKNKDVLKRLIVLIKENKILSEIFGANYHSQLISRSNEIVKLLSVENELENDDIKLIWSCTKRGDLEAKLIILKLLSEISPYLKEDYIEILLNNIISNIDTKISQEEVELVIKLSSQENSNEKNIMLGCDYLCKCLLMSNNLNIKNNQILEKLLSLAEKNDIYLKKVLDICENYIKNNDKTILSYSILTEIMEKYLNNEKINDFTKDQHLLHLFEDNFNLYVKQTKELLSKNNISFSEGEKIDKFIVDGFSHLDNVQKRMDVYPFLINKLYTDYDFIPFLKGVLITDPVSPNDQLIFYDFVKKYITNNENTSEDAISRKEKIRQNLFDLLSENNQTEITVEKLNLFIALFIDMNKVKKDDDNNNENENEILEVENIEELKGLDKLWNIIFQIKDEKTLSVGISKIFQIYKNKNLDKLLEKCSNLIKEENATSETIDKCVMILKLIIVESEKNNLFRPKSHLSLIKSCLINLPLEIPEKQNVNNEDIDKHLLLGNTNLNELKILISKLYSIPPNGVLFEFKEKYSKFLNKNKLDEKIDESNNNTSLCEIILENNKLNESSNLKPKEKISFNFKNKSMEKEQLMINGEMNPKLIKVLQDSFRQFTHGSDKMDRSAIADFINCVTSKTTNKISEDDRRVSNFIRDNKEEDDDEFVKEKGFINFYENSLKKGKDAAVWSNLKAMNIGEDLRRTDAPFEISFVENDKLPRYKLGNNLPFIESLIEKYYKNPNTNSSLIDLLLFLTTNESIYNNVLENLFNNEESAKKDSFVGKILNDSDKDSYVEQNYIFVIIESILQDMELYLYNKYIDQNDMVILGDGQYKIKSEKYEPFDNEEKIEKKMNFVKTLSKSENLEKIIKTVNDLFEKIAKINKENKDEKATPKLYDCCLRGLRIINILNNFNEDNVKENKNCLKELKEDGIYKLGFCNLSSLFPDINIKEELNKISFLNLVNNLIIYLNDSQKKESENDNCLQKECLNLLINLLSSKKQLLEEYKSRNETEKDLMINLFKNYFSEDESPRKTYFIQNIILSINKAKNNQNNDYINFLFKSVNSFLDNLFNSQLEQNENESETKTKTIIPDNSFFELYNSLYKIISENKDESEETRKENSLVFKTHDLLMKFIDKIEQGKKVDIKIFLSLLKLLEMPIKEDQKLKEEILFKEINGRTLYDFLLKKSISQFKEEKKEEESLIDTDNNENNENEGNNKFICLDNLKEEKKDDSSNEELIEISNKFMLKCFERTRNQKLILELIKIINLIIKAKKGNGNDNNDDDDDDKSDEANSGNNNYSTKNFGHVGLKNLGCICYMNSIIQQMYMCPTFRYAIMSADDGEPEKPANNAVDDDNLLHQLQIMFTYLTYSDRMDYSPRDFCYSYKDFDGKPMNLGAQQDSQEFYNNFCDKIENCLKKTKLKYIVTDVFAGKSCSSVTCENCKHISNRFEDFYNLTVEVKNFTNLNDSLQKINVPEIIDDFKCSNCNQKVTIKKVTALNKLPNVLIVQLKRFSLNYDTGNTQKINSRFEFPKILNLKQFCSEQFNTEETLDTYNRVDDYYEYVLKGINVHRGSADRGHYFSFIDVNRDGKNNLINTYTKEDWLQFNDSVVSEFNIDSIEEQCFGGSSQGHENYQNAYLLLYERRKKTPIKILIEEKDIDKEKDDIVEITDENKSSIYKKYDLSRIKPDVKEEEVYNKIFFDKEKNEYFKYIPYYNIPKYAPRKVYNTIMKENTSTPSPKSLNNQRKNYLKEYKNVLFGVVKEKGFDINNENFDDNIKETIISIVLNYFMKVITSNQTFDDDQKEEINKEFTFIIRKLIKPLIKEDACFSILKIINKHLNKDENSTAIFACNMSHSNSDNIISQENAKEVCDILFELIKIFSSKKEKRNCSNEYKLIIKSLINLIENSNRSRSDPDDENDEKYAMIFVYELIYKLCTFNEEFLTKLIDKEIIILLIGKLENEMKKIRLVIYDTVTYLIKQTTQYNRKLFDLDIDEKEGTIDFREIMNLRQINDKIINVLFEERNDLLMILLTILVYEDIDFTRNFYFEFLIKLYEKYCYNEAKMMDLIDILLTLIKVNDKYTFERLYNILGFPNIIIKQIPRNNDTDDDNSNNDKENKNDNSSNQKQNWPLFGAKLLDDDIDKPIYEYICMNIRDNSFCLLKLLFPNEDTEDKKEEKENKKKVKLSNEDKKNIILELFNNCFRKNNYSLFKYIYLTPAPSLRHRNLYEKMKEFVQEEDKAVNMKIFEEKEERFIFNIERETNNEIDKAKNPERNRYNEDNYYNEDEDLILPGLEEFNIYEKKMKKFIGFNSDIIPGDIVREEIIQIASKNSMAIYRIEYYTKYYKTDELRNILLTKNKKEEEKNESKKDDNKEDEKKEENKGENEEKKEEKNDEDKKDDNKDDEKKEENKGEDEDKKDEGKKELENENNKEGEDKDNKSEKNKAIGENNEDRNSSNSEEENKEENEAKQEITETEIDDSLEKENRYVDKYDISEKNENSFIYRTSNDNETKIILEDKSLKNKNKVKSTLYRFIFTNRDGEEKCYRAQLDKSKKLDDKIKLNYFVPFLVFDKIGPNDISNFYNIMRIRGDLPFLKRDDIKISITLSNNFSLD